MLKFILNNTLIETELPQGMALLDFVRKERALKGSKLVCKEGECGACSVLVGSLENGEMHYQSMTSCIMPMVNAHGKHIVTIEGLNMEELSPVQQAMVDCYGTQCGFCTPGFVVSLSGYMLSAKSYSKEGIIASIDGNICRCTGYKSIERAAKIVLKQLQEQQPKASLKDLASKGFVPDYFASIPERLAQFETTKTSSNGQIALGGGSDLYVQKPYQMYEETAHAVFDQSELNYLYLEGNICRFGAATTMGDLYRSKAFNEAVPGLEEFFKLLSSTQIRNMSTIGGNLVNASPIGDFTNLLLALNSSIVLKKGDSSRTVLLKHFYKGYKQMDLAPGEMLTEIQFSIPNAQTYVHFEKVSQRKYFDIASVNFSSRIELDENKQILEANMAVGGVSAIPLYLHQTSNFLQNQPLHASTIEEAIGQLNQEIAPISDARGSADYKRLLARQLMIAQFLAIDPEIFPVKKLVGI